MRLRSLTFLSATDSSAQKLRLSRSAAASLARLPKKGFIFVGDGWPAGREEGAALFERSDSPVDFRRFSGMCALSSLSPPARRGFMPRKSLDGGLGGCSLGGHANPVKSGVARWRRTPAQGTRRQGNRGINPAADRCGSVYPGFVHYIFSIDRFIREF